MDLDILFNDSSGYMNWTTTMYTYVSSYIFETNAMNDPKTTRLKRQGTAARIVSECHAKNKCIVWRI